MANTGDFVSIKLIADRLKRNPLMKDMNYEFIIDNAVELLSILEYPTTYVTMREKLNVSKYRALKPANMMSIEGVARTDEGYYRALVASHNLHQEFLHTGDFRSDRLDLTYTVNNKHINVNFEEGEIDVIYKSIAVDEECYPLILNNATLLRCIESYIKYKWFDILNDIDVVSDRKLNKAEQDYTFNVAQADVNLKLPSQDEMEALTNMITQLIPSQTEFINRFEFLGAQEFLRIN